MRGIRKAIKKTFEETLDPQGNSISIGKHRWKEAKWLAKGAFFLEHHGIKEPTDFEVAAIVMLVYPAFGSGADRNDRVMKPRL